MQATIKSKLQAGQDASTASSRSAATVRRRRGGRGQGRPAASAKVGTFDLSADVIKDIMDGKILFAVDQQPYVQGYLGVTGST